MFVYTNIHEILLLITCCGKFLVLTFSLTLPLGMCKQNEVIWSMILKTVIF